MGGGGGIESGAGGGIGRPRDEAGRSLGGGGGGGGEDGGDGVERACRWAADCDLRGSWANCGRGGIGVGEAGAELCRLGCEVAARAGAGRLEWLVFGRVGG